MLNISFDYSYQFGDRFKNPTPNALVGQITEPALDHVEPGAGSRHKVQMEPRMAFQPRFDLRVLMGSIIVYDQMQVQLSWGLLINQCEKLYPLLMAVAVHAGSNDVPLGHLQGSEQGSRSIAFVVVGHGSQASLDQWQSWLGPVQRLNRCFLISTQHQRVLGSVQIQAHHIENFFNKLLVPADFERLGQMRLQTAGLPHPVHHRLVDAQRIGQRPNAPVRGVSGLALGGCLDDQRGHVFSLLWFSATSWSILFNPRQSLLDKPSAPSRHLAAVNSQKLGNRFVLFSFSRHQHDLGPLRQACGRSATPRPARKCVNFTFSQLNRWCYSHGTYLLNFRRRISPINSETLH